MSAISYLPDKPDGEISFRYMFTLVSKHFLRVKKIGCPHRKPTIRLLIEVQTPADLDGPAIVKPDLTVVHFLVQVDVERYVESSRLCLSSASFSCSPAMSVC